MGVEIRFFILNSADVAECDRYVSQLTKTPLGRDCTFFRFTEGMDFQLYGIDPTAVREDQFLVIAAELSALVPKSVLAGMVIDNAGFDGAWIFQNGTLTDGFASSVESKLPESIITDDPVTAGLQVLNLCDVKSGHIYSVIEDCVEPVAVPGKKHFPLPGSTDTPGKFERKVRLRLNNYRERHSKYNRSDYHKYKTSGNMNCDMNRYFGFALQRGWTVPFILSEWKAARAPIQQYCALHDERFEYYRSRAGEEDYVEWTLARHGSAFLYLAAGRIADAKKTLDVADELKSKYTYFSESKVISACAVAPERLERYRIDDITRVEIPVAERHASTEETLAFVAYINLFYSLFSSDRDMIRTSFEDYASCIGAVPKLVFLSGKSTFLNNPRQFYLAFQNAVKHMIEGSTKAIDAVWEMQWWLNSVDSDYGLSFKCLELFARSCAGEEIDQNFKQEFPALAELLKQATWQKNE